MNLDNLDTQTLDEKLDSEEFKNEVDSYEYNSELEDEKITEEDLREYELNFRVIDSFNHSSSY